MQISWVTFLIICPALFITGFVNSIGGGGALISLPVYMLAGLPVHSAVATNKLSSTCGATVSSLTFIKEKLINFKIVFPSVIVAVIGSSFGAMVSLSIPEWLLEDMMIIVLPCIALVIFKSPSTNTVDVTMVENKKIMYITTMVASLLIGFYDGIYGPGTGTLLIIAFRFISKINLKQSNGMAKIINWVTDVSALVVFLFNHQIIFCIGIPAALCNMSGSYFGSKLVVKNGDKVIKPCICFMMVLLLIKIVYEKVK